MTGLTLALTAMSVAVASAAADLPRRFQQSA